MKGILVLEDGRYFEGEGFGARVEMAGEVVFNTGMTGYQEVLTDPSYCGQIVTMTYPLIGNYGVNPDDSESLIPRVRGFVVREACQAPSHWRATQTIDEYLQDNGIPGLTGIDTRSLTRHLRSHGTLRGVIASGLGKIEPEYIARLVEMSKTVDNTTAVAQVTTAKPYRIFGNGPRVAVIDFGLKQNILRSLSTFDCDLVVVPASTPVSDVLELNPDGIMLTNGPADPKDVKGAIETVRALIGKLPVFGICLGHQIMSLAMGADTYKLKYGHRGANHPVKDLLTGRVYITSQNHGYAVSEESIRHLPMEVTHKNLNDGTVEGVRHKHLPVFSVQYHPEAAPGPEDSRYLFDRFMDLLPGRSARRLA